MLFFCAIGFLTLLFINNGRDKERARLKNQEPVYHSGEFHVPVLLYHYVEFVQDENDAVRKSLNLTPDIFLSQMISLAQNGYEFLTIREVVDIADGANLPPNKAVAVTFDDGYRDFYTDVYPILTKQRVKATVYLVPGLIGDKNFMDWHQVREIAKSGLVEVGAHTLTHRRLSGMNRSFLWTEIVLGKHLLEDVLRQEVVSFAYPYGSSDQQAQEMVKAAGFRSAAGVSEGSGNFSPQTRFLFSRIRPGLRTGNELIDYLTLEMTKYQQ